MDSVAASRRLKTRNWRQCTLDICSDLLPTAPLPPVQKRDAQHKFSQHEGAHTDATGSQRFQITRFESQGQKPFESLLRLYFFFAFKISFKSRDSIRYRSRIARSVLQIVGSLSAESSLINLVRRRLANY